MPRKRRKESTSRTDAPDESHEAKCRRCGKCCWDKYIIGDRMYFGKGKCQYLDETTNLCTIYEDRHELNPGCLPVKRGIELGVFPADCPYVADLPNYEPPVDEIIDDDTLRLVERGRIMTPEQLEEHLRLKREKQASQQRSRRRRKGKE